MNSLQIKNLYVNVGDKEIISGLNLHIKRGEVHAIMGPNGSGKSTLANVIMGHPKYKITSGQIILDGKDITELSPDKKAALGLFLSMQHPPEISGVSTSNFLRACSEQLNKEKYNPIKFYQDLLQKTKEMEINQDFVKRYLNVGFSGGEKKQMEVVQLSILNPVYAILDEIDSGLDVDALKKVSKGINKYHNKDNSVLIITHYNRILRYVKPDFVHIMKNGKIIKSGNASLAEEIEKKGYN